MLVIVGYVPSEGYTYSYIYIYVYIYRDTHVHKYSYQYSDIACWGTYIHIYTYPMSKERINLPAMTGSWVLGWFSEDYCHPVCLVKVYWVYPEKLRTYVAYIYIHVYLYKSYNIYIYVYIYSWVWIIIWNMYPHLNVIPFKTLSKAFVATGESNDSLPLPLPTGMILHGFSFWNRFFFWLRWVNFDLRWWLGMVG